MNLFYVQIDNNGHIVRYTTSNESNASGWYLAAINDAHVNDFKINYRKYRYDVKADDVIYPDNANYHDLIRPNILGSLDDLALDDKSMANRLNSISTGPVSAGGTDSLSGSVSNLANSAKNQSNSTQSLSSSVNELSGSVSTLSGSDSNDYTRLSSEMNDDNTSLSNANASLSSANTTISSLVNSFNSLSDLVNTRAVLRHITPMNLAPDYWMYMTHNDPHTFYVPVQEGKIYWISAYVHEDISGVPVRAFTPWHVVDDWGDLTPNDTGAGLNQTYKVSFIAPKTGNMPIYFNFTQVGKALSRNPVFCVRDITVTQTSKYVPYEDANNNNQSIADVGGDAGMDAVAWFGPKFLHGYQGHPVKHDSGNNNTPVINSHTNIFPNYWVDASHNDPYTFSVPVQQGHHYHLSAIISNDPSNVPLRASSSWNVADEWGDIVPNDAGTAGVNNMYHIDFVAPRTGNMPIEFIFTSVAKAIQAGNAGMMLKRITMTDSQTYIPYTKCDNSHQSLKDVTGDAGMDAKAMFGNL